MSAHEDLIAAAKGARSHAYAPYSGYQVGSCVRAGGELYSGANIENASYGLSICAERNAIAGAVFAGHREIEAIAVATQSSPPAAPCGMCLQTLNEFVSDPSALAIVLINPSGERRDTTLAELFPQGFRRDQLPAR